MNFLLKCRHLPGFFFWSFVLGALVSINMVSGDEYQGGEKPLKFEMVLLATDLFKSVSLESKTGQVMNRYTIYKRGSPWPARIALYLHGIILKHAC